MLQPNIGYTLRPVLMAFTRSGITPPNEPILVKYGALRVHSRRLAVAHFGLDRSSSAMWIAEQIFVFFLSGKQRTILPIFHRPNFTKFEHNTSIGVAIYHIGTDRLEGKGENYQVCSVQYCVQQLCTVQCTHI